MSRKSHAMLAATFVLAVSAAYGAAWLKARALVNEQLQQLVASGTYEKADYASLFLLPTGTLSINGLELKQPDFDLVFEQVTLSDIDFFNAAPRHLAINLHHIRFPQGLPDLSHYSPLLATLLRTVSHDNTVLAEVAYAFHTDGNDTERMQSSLSVTLPNLFSLQSDVESVHLQQDNNASANSALPQTLSPDAAIPHATVKLHDEGIVDTFLQAMARDSNTPLADTRAVLASQFENAHLLLPANLQNLSRQAGGGLAKFLQGGKTLMLSVTPAHEGKLSQLQQELMGVVLTGGYDKAADLLQLKITTE